MTSSYFLEETFLKTLSFIFLLLISQHKLFAKTYDSNFSENIRDDREKLFYVICNDALKESTKAWLCSHYAVRITGEDFDSIMTSMQLEFNNLAKRNKKVPIVSLTKKRTLKDFKKILEANKRPEDYVAAVLDLPAPTPKPSANQDGTLDGDVVGRVQDETTSDSVSDSEKESKPAEDEKSKLAELSQDEKDNAVKKSIFDNAKYVDASVVDLIELEENDKLPRNNPRNNPNNKPSQKTDQKPSAVGTIQIDPSKNGNSLAADEVEPMAPPAKPTQKTDRDSGVQYTTSDKALDLYDFALDEALTKLCKKLIFDKGEYQDETQQYCEKFADSQHGKSIQDIREALKNDPKISSDVKEDLLKKLIIVVASKQGKLPSDFEDFVNSGAVRVAKAAETKPADTAATNPVDVKGPKTDVSDTGNARSPAVIEPTNNDGTNSRDAIDLLNDAYDRILLSEIEKNCPNHDQKCIDEITKKVNEARDRAIAAMTPASSSPVAVAEDDKKPAENSGNLELDRSPATIATTEVKCSDAIQQRIRELLEGDENNMLGKQFQLTSLKMALQIMENRTKKSYDNVEEYINADQKDLLNKDNQKVLDKLVGFYRNYGKVEDESFISDSFDKVKNSNYFKSSTRIYNDSASVLILADSMTNENSRFSELDAASAWFASKVNEKFRTGTYHNNLTNLSSLTFRVLGKLKNEKPPININKLKDGIAKIEADLDGNYELMRQDISEKFADCFKGENVSCNSKENFDQNVARSIMDLTSKITTSDNFVLEVQKSLRGSINGKYKFDFLPGQYK